MSGCERDSVEDWALPERSRPPLLGELIERIDEALTTARASEAAVMTVGAAALDAAEQARRAAELAERSSAAAAGIARLAEPTTPTSADVVRQPAARIPLGAGARSAFQAENEGLRDFTSRADRISERLRKLQLV